MKNDGSDNRARFRFYEELNDFLPGGQKKQWIEYAFFGNPGVKDSIEALGVPHTEVDLILANGKSVDFGYRLHDGDRISVYPVFERLDISGITRLRERPLRVPRFICDVHLGRLARDLRMLGFDTVYENDLGDARIVEIAEREKRAVLTRDVQLLKHGRLTRGYWIRSQRPERQLQETLDQFDLYRLIDPLSRCLVCNTPVEPVEKSAIIDRLQPKTMQYFDEFYRCPGCERIYWKGSHYEKMLRSIGRLQKRPGKE